MRQKPNRLRASAGIRRRIGLATGLALAAAWQALGCGARSGGMELLPPESAAATAVPKMALEVDQVRPRSVEVLAYGRGNIVDVSIINFLDKPILVGPKMFGVLAAGKIVPASPNVKIFPVRTLKPQEGVVGRLQFPGARSLVGQKLVFNSPEAKAMVAIQPQENVAGGAGSSTTSVQTKRREMTQWEKERQQLLEDTMRRMQKARR